MSPQVSPERKNKSKSKQLLKMTEKVLKNENIGDLPLPEQYKYIQNNLNVIKKLPGSKNDTGSYKGKDSNHSSPSNSNKLRLPSMSPMKIKGP